MESRSFGDARLEEIDPVPDVDCVSGWARCDEREDVADLPGRESRLSCREKDASQKKGREFPKRWINYIKFRLLGKDLQRQLGFFRRDPDSGCVQRIIFHSA